MREAPEDCSSGENPLRECSVHHLHALYELSCDPGWHYAWPHLSHGHDGTWPWCLSDVVFPGSPA